MGLSPALQETKAKVYRSTVEAWRAELVALRRDPTVRRFIDLQDKIDESQAFRIEDVLASPAPWTGPYDLYDFFEFAGDLAGKRMSTQQVTRLARGRFPEMSNAGRQVILHFLVESGYAKVTRRTAAGRPAAYRFTPPSEGRDGKWSGIVLPTNELCRFKAADLDDPGGFVPRDGERG